MARHVYTTIDYTRSNIVFRPYVVTLGVRGEHNASVVIELPDHTIKLSAKQFEALRKAFHDYPEARHG